MGVLVNDMYTVVMAILGFIIGILLVIIISLILERIRKEPPLVKKIKQLARNSSMEHERVLIMDPRIIPILMENWVIERDNLDPEQVTVLEKTGFIRSEGDIIIVNTEAIKTYIESINTSIQQPSIPTIHDCSPRIAKYGILSLTFFGIESSVGPVIKYTTALTKFTRKLIEDEELRANIFILSRRVEEVNMEGARIIIIEIGGGERGVGGYIVAELTKNADATKVKQILSRIRQIPETVQSAKEILSEI